MRDIRFAMSKSIIAATFLFATLMPPTDVVAVATNSDWSPVLDESAHKEATEGRPIHTYRHAARKEWGYAEGRGKSVFYVVCPENSRDGAPLYVMLHAAGHNSWTAIKAGFSESADESHIDYAMCRTPDEFYGLYLSADSWWGREVPGDPSQYATQDCPVEKRVLDTLAWVMDTYDIDTNRVYLAGLSMGGSGALGIGMRHGEIFASMRVWVPAGTKHVARRMFFGERIPAGVFIPDPPVLVNMSAQNDSWSKDQEVLIRGVADRKYAMIMGWGPFGHAGDSRVFDDNCPAVAAFHWLDILTDQAYPVFTGATTDQRPPWLYPDGDKRGQINGFFRWKNGEDTATAFSMQVWLAQPTGTNTPPVDMPKESIADIAFRRLQRFRIPPGGDCLWELLRNGTKLASGTIQPDASGLLTVPKVKITANSTEIRLGVTHLKHAGQN